MDGKWTLQIGGIFLNLHSHYDTKTERKKRVKEQEEEVKNNKHETGFEHGYGSFKLLFPQKFKKGDDIYFMFSLAVEQACLWDPSQYVTGADKSGANRALCPSHQDQLAFPNVEDFYFMPHNDEHGQLLWVLDPSQVQL